METSQCVPVKAGQTTVDSPQIVAKDAGKHYFRERLKTTPGTPGKPSETVSYGKPRVPGETVVVRTPLAQTGAAFGGLAAVGAMLAMAGAWALSVRSRKARRH